jgi:hypothetical protein
MTNENDGTTTKWNSDNAMEQIDNNVMAVRRILIAIMIIYDVVIPSLAMTVAALAASVAA